jgi:hypothetical protein
MMGAKFSALLLSAGITLGIYAAMSAPGCYDPHNPPPCDPSTVDWPRCRPWDPPMAVHDGGAER